MRKLRIRELYCPAHFGNTYEVAGANEMHELLSEGMFWGYNRFSDWFDTIDLRNLYQKKDGHFDMPEAIWARKFDNFSIAASLGFDLGLLMTPNHVFFDQVNADNEAEKSSNMYGQLVCPSKPGVVAMILENYRNLFQDFAKRHLTLSAISAAAYDYGGCHCATCRPWIVAYGKLTREIVQLAREFFPQINAELCGWWWSDEDHEAFTKWADRETPGMFQAMTHHLRYGQTAYKKRAVPMGCKDRAFVHIGYGDVRKLDVPSGDLRRCDIYGHYGPTIAPRRIEQTVSFLEADQSDGFLAYSEGMFDEINKAILGGLGSGQYTSAEEVLRAYADRHLGGDVNAWGAWLYRMGEIAQVKPAEARREFDRLAAASRPGYRLQALDEKLKMLEADTSVRAGKHWTTSRLRTAQAFWDAKERLWRDIWGLGLSRAVFKFDDYEAPEWNKEYNAQIQGSLSERMGQTEAEA